MMKTFSIKVFCIKKWYVYFV